MLKWEAVVNEDFEPVRWASQVDLGPWDCIVTPRIPAARVEVLRSVPPLAAKRLGQLRGC